MGKTIIFASFVFVVLFTGCTNTVEDNSSVQTTLEQTNKVSDITEQEVEESTIEQIDSEVEEQETEEPSEPEINPMSLEGVAVHDNADDCWLVIDGKIYDVTGYDTSHPGGEAVLKGCGQDATELFNTKDLGANAHGHSGAAKTQLENFYIGDLEQ